MNWIQRFKSWSRIKQIACIVFATHFLLIFCLTIHHFISTTPSKRPIAVRTVRVPVAASALAQAPQVQKKPTAKPTKKNVAPNATSKTSKKKALSQQPLPAPKTEKIVPAIKPAPELFVPQLPDVKPLYIEDSSLDFSYEEQLIALFQTALDLPEIGEVKARLEIDAKGQLVSCTILESRSRKNEEFLKNRLPELLFPLKEGTDRQSFTVTFRNAP